MQHIFTYSSKRHSAASGLFGCVCSEALSSFELHPGGLNYSQALVLGHLRSNDYPTTKIYVDNFLFSDNVD